MDENPFEIFELGTCRLLREGGIGEVGTFFTKYKNDQLNQILATPENEVILDLVHELQGAMNFYLALKQHVHEEDQKRDRENA